MEHDTKQVVIVTGGSTHIGRAIAEELAQRESLVYIASRDGDRCTRVATEISREYGECRGASVDVTDLDSVTALLERVVTEVGRFDAVVANAGGRVQVEPPPDRHAQDVIQLNLLGAINTASEASRALADRGGGAVVLVSSVHGLVGSDPRLYEGISGFVPSPVAYHSAKGGVIQLARSLGAQWGHAGVRVNAVSPGVIAGPNIPHILADRVAERTPLRRVGTAEEVASVVRFLVSADASWVTGQNIVVDGGWSIW